MQVFKIGLTGIIFSLISCANLSEIPELRKSKAKLKLADGASISTEQYDESNPLIVRKINGYLYLIFGSDRPCSYGCSGGSHNLFVSRSVTTYSSGKALPAFETPEVVTFNTTALNLTPKINFVAKDNGSNIRIYLKDASVIQYNDIPESPGPWGYVSSGTTGIINSTESDGTILGITVDNALFRKNNAGNIIVFSPDSAGAGMQLTNTDLSNVLSMAHMRAGITGNSQTALVVSAENNVFGGSATVTFGGLGGLNRSLESERIFINNLRIMYGTSAESDLVTFSASETRNGKSDMYVITSHSPADLWNSIE